MKRSEMTLLMTYAYQNSHRGGLSEMSDEQRMGYILDIMIDAGMSPPGYIALMRNGKPYLPDTDSSYDTFLAKGWEPEDE
jgi:hypothetical protein